MIRTSPYLCNDMDVVLEFITTAQWVWNLNFRGSALPTLTVVQHLIENGMHCTCERNLGAMRKLQHFQGLCVVTGFSNCNTFVSLSLAFSPPFIFLDFI